MIKVSKILAVAAGMGVVGALAVGIGGSASAVDVPCTTVCYVDAAAGSDAFGGSTPSTAKQHIQAAIDQVDAGGQVRVLPGAYDETAADRSPASLAGTYQFGLFFPAAKPGITVMGVTAGDAAITDASAVQATITTNATNNFGYSGIFVEAANTTLQGVELGPNAAGDNKTVEVVADGFTLRDVDTSIPDGGAIYISEFDPPAAAVSSYDIRENLFDDGTQVALSSGAGVSGGVASRQIRDNVFAMGGGTWPGISFNGAGGVPWYTKQVGGAVIQGNTFSGSTQYIRARGSYLEAQFDWQSFWNDNTYDGATVALVTHSPFDVRSFSYTSDAYTFTNVRRIGGTIQGEVGVAQAGDTVLVKPGTYQEDVVVNKANLKLLGAGAGQSTIVGTMGDSTVTTLEVSAGGAGALIDGFTVTRAGNTVADWNGPLNNQGVAIYGNGTTLQHTQVTGNRNGIFLYSTKNVSILANDIDSNRTGIHLVNDVTGLVVRNNFITDNWTIGVLFRDESSPNGTGVVTIRDNAISGNWYSQVEARSLFSAPALDVTRNWLGTTAPTVAAAASSGEPGYSVQIPTAFGGTAVPPAGSPTIVWNPVNVTNPVSYIPFQCTGTDTSAAFGFQPAGLLSDGIGQCLTFSGFFQPVDNTKVNVVKAGQTIPVKWRLLAGSVPVSDPSSFVSLTSQRVSCATFDTPLDLIEEVTTNPSGLLYTGDGNWQFNWKTPKSYAGQCRIMTVTLADGTTHSADFQFK